MTTPKPPASLRIPACHDDFDMAPFPVAADSKDEMMTPEDIDRITLAVYRARLDADSEGNADRMVERDKDAGEKQARRSASYRPVVVETLVQAGLYERPVRVAPNRKSAEPPLLSARQEQA